MGGQLLNRRIEWLTIRKYAELAGLPLTTLPYMLCHTCGFALADPEQTRGSLHIIWHRDIQHTFMDTAANPLR